MNSRDGSSANKTALFGLLVLLLPLSADLLTRGSRLFLFNQRERWVYALALVVSTLFWASLVLLAANRSSALRFVWQALLLSLACLLFAGQIEFYRIYASFAAADALKTVFAIGPLILEQGKRDSAAITLGCGSYAGYVILLVLLARRWRLFGSLGGGLLSLLWVAALGIILGSSNRLGAHQPASADVIGLGAIGQATLWQLRQHSHPRSLARFVEYVPVQSLPDPAQSVVLILTESVRADVVCSEPGSECPASRFTNQALPNRIGLTELRAVDSSTLLSYAVLFGGREPSQSLAVMKHVPLLWDMAHAAGYRTGYLTSQNLDYSYLSSFVDRFALDERCNSYEFEKTSDMGLGAPDERLIPRVRAFLERSDKPYVLVVHLSNTHLPYRTDSSLAPFQPAAYTQDVNRSRELFNQYKNAVLLQDRTVADLVATTRNTRAGSGAIILYTSDHGEAFREHGQLTHSDSLYDEELRVPGWIDLPAGWQQKPEAGRLRENAHQPTYLSDFLPTMMDLLGLYDRKELWAMRRHWVGVSLLRRTTAARPLMLSTCAEDWVCPFRIRGATNGTMKWVGATNAKSQCYDLRRDPMEQHPLPLQDCSDLDRFHF